MPPKTANQDELLRRAAPSLEEAAVNEILGVGDEDVSVIVSWNSAHTAPAHVAFELSGKEAATLLAASLKRRAQKVKEPRRELKEAIDEGRALGSRFSSAEDLFHALEVEGDGQAGR